MKACFTAVMGKSCYEKWTVNEPVFFFFFFFFFVVVVVVYFYFMIPNKRLLELIADRVILKLNSTMTCISVLDSISE